MYDGVRLQYGQKSSAYDRFNGVDPDTLAIDGSYAPKASNIVPLIGGTVIPLGIDGSLKTPYIFLCENAGGKIDWNKKFVTVNGLNIGDGLSVESGLAAEAVEFGGVNAYKITASNQGKIMITPSILANKNKITFSVFMPETSTAKLQGYGEFSIRVKPNSLVGGYITFVSDSIDEARKIVFGVCVYEHKNSLFFKRFTVFCGCYAVFLFKLIYKIRNAFDTYRVAAFLDGIRRGLQQKRRMVKP